jgi:hypothetical protein
MKKFCFRSDRPRINKKKSIKTISSSVMGYFYLRTPATALGSDIFQTFMFCEWDNMLLSPRTSAQVSGISFRIRRSLRFAFEA